MIWPRSASVKAPVCWIRSQAIVELAAAVVHQVATAFAVGLRQTIQVWAAAEHQAFECLPVVPVAGGPEPQAECGSRGQVAILPYEEVVWILARPDLALRVAEHGIAVQLGQGGSHTAAVVRLELCCLTGKEHLMQERNAALRAGALDQTGQLCGCLAASGQVRSGHDHAVVPEMERIAYRA